MNKSLLTDKNRMTVLSNMAADHATDILDAFGVDYTEIGKRLTGPCPVHGGNNRGAFNVYPNGEAVRGYWKCRSRNCQKLFGATFIGLIRGLLSNKKFGWNKSGDKFVTFQDTVKWVCEYLDIKLENVSIDHESLEKAKFIRSINLINPAQNKPKSIISREIVRAKLDIPSEYYIKRGYSGNILDRYDVGLCTDSEREMYNRVVVPIYDDSYKFIIGCTGRTIFNRCEKCTFYHRDTENCPNEDKPWEIMKCFKWRHNKGFRANQSLYNYWFSKEHIENTRVVILVEGPGDVWKLEESGIKNSVAIFGTNLTDEQQIILERSGAMSVIVLLDNDEAGHKASVEIKDQLERSFKMYFPAISESDVGDMNIDEITEEVKPFIERVKE